MLNDFTPYVYLTNDYGKTWKRIADGTNGIPAGDYTRVVREDPDRPGLLYAGTEHGMYISFDEGAHWQSFQQNLPATPIMDLKVYPQEPDRRDRRPLVLDARRAAGGGAAQGRARLDGGDAVQAGRRVSPGRTAADVLLLASRMQPTAPVTVEVKDAKGAVVYTDDGAAVRGTAAGSGRDPARGAGRRRARWTRRWRRWRRARRIRRRWRRRARERASGTEPGDVERDGSTRRSRCRRASSCGAAAADEAAARRRRRASIPSRCLQARGRRRRPSVSTAIRDCRR